MDCALSKIVYKFVGFCHLNRLSTFPKNNFLQKIKGNHPDVTRIKGNTLYGHLFTPAGRSVGVTFRPPTHKFSDKLPRLELISQVTQRGTCRYCLLGDVSRAAQNAGIGVHIEQPLLQLLHVAVQFEPPVSRHVGGHAHVCVGQLFLKHLRLGVVDEHHVVIDDVDTLEVHLVGEYQLVELGGVLEEGAGAQVGPLGKFSPQIIKAVLRGL